MEELPIICCDDAECISILTAANRLESIMAKSSNSGDNLSAVFFEYRGHWAMGCRHFGHDEDHMNGFIVTMLPQSATTKKEAIKVFMDTLSNSTESDYPDFHVEEVRTQKQENN